MNELLFFVMIIGVVALSYYLGYAKAINKNLKEEVRDFIFGMTISKMAHKHFQQSAINETKQFLKMLGVKNPKNIKPIKLMTVEEFDKENKQ